MKQRSFRISEAEDAILEAKAEKAGITVSEYCRASVLDYEIRDTLPRQQIGKVLCSSHNKIDDAKTLTEVKTVSHEMETEIWQLIG